MSQRQLAQQSGVDHSTISRLIRGDRMPSLGTATKLARGLRELREDADTAQYLGLVTAGAMNPTARVEYALRADEMLSEPQVRQIMEYYLAVRMRRFGRAFQPAEGRRPRRNRPPDRSTVGRSQPTSDSPVVAGVGQARTECASSRPIGRPMGRPGRPVGLLPPNSPQGTTRIALHVRVSGTANAGIWGAGVRDSSCLRATAVAQERRWPRCRAAVLAHGTLRCARSGAPGRLALARPSATNAVAGALLAQERRWPALPAARPRSRTLQVRSLRSSPGALPSSPLRDERRSA